MPIDAVFRQALSASERQIDAAALWSTYSQSALAPATPRGGIPQAHALASVSTSTVTQYHVLGINVGSSCSSSSSSKHGGGSNSRTAMQEDGGTPAVAVFASDMYPAPPTEAMFAVRDWHRSGECKSGADAVATGCVRVTNGGAGSPLITLDEGMEWPFGTYTTQLYTATVMQPKGAFTLLGELDKFVPLSSKRFSRVNASAVGLTATVVGKVGEVVHATALQPNSASVASSWSVVLADVTIGPDGTGQLIM